MAASSFLTIDVDEFDDLMSEARAHERAGVPSLALESYQIAAEPYRGDYLAESIDRDLGYEERTTFRLEFVAAATRCRQLLTAAGRAREAAGYVERAIEAEPLAEAGWAALLGALASMGRTGGVRAASQRCLRVFGEAGLEPTDSLRRLLT